MFPQTSSQPILLSIIFLAATSFAHPISPPTPFPIPPVGTKSTNNSTSTPPTSLQTINSTTPPLAQNTTSDLSAPSPSSHNHTHISLLASLIAGTAAVSAILIFVFWMCRHRERARRRRLGEMMGLAGVRDGILRSVGNKKKGEVVGAGRVWRNFGHGERKVGKGSVGWK